MTKAELLGLVLEKAPKDSHSQLVLTYLVLACNEHLEVALSPLALAQRTGMHERTAKRVVSDLCSGGFLESLSENSFRIAAHTRVRAHARARNKENYLYSSISLKNLKDAEMPYNSARAGLIEPEPLPYRSHSGSTAQPTGVGQRQSLGVETCPKCGGTGWQEVLPCVSGRQLTVDICSCRGGPDVTVPPPGPPALPTLSEHQRAVNVDGLTAIREVLSNEPQTRTEYKELEDTQETGPGT
jgi:hypothetical protein